MSQNPKCKARVILITDGQVFIHFPKLLTKIKVSDSQEVLSFVKLNSTKWSLFCLGIGNDVDASFLQATSSAGKFLSYLLVKYRKRCCRVC